VKGLPVLLGAVAELAKSQNDLRLDIVGDGPDRSSLTAQAQRLAIAERVAFLGYQSQAQVRQLLAETDVFVMSSFAEGVPVVLMEAMAAGVPVVATRIAGIPELVDDGTSGFLVPPGDPTLLAEKIETLLNDPDLRNRFGAAGREKVEREFNLLTESERLCQILTEAMDGRVAPVRPEVSVVSVRKEASPGETRMGVVA
jgi:glycosyltransferase involved in cell wall biosynthesis